MARVKQVVEMNGKNGKLYREWLKFAHLGVGCPFSTDALLNPVVSSDTCRRETNLPIISFPEMAYP